MVSKQVFSMTLTVENIMGVYRNYAFVSKRSQRLSTLRILAETVICSGIFVYDMYYVAGQSVDRLIYVYEYNQLVKLLNGPVIMISGALNSRSFKLFKDNFKFVHQQFLNESSYVKYSRKLKVVFVIIITVTFISSTGFEASKMIGRLHKSPEPNICFAIILFLGNMVVQNRFILEHAVMYIYITMVRNLLNCLNNSIFDIEVKYDESKKRLCSDSTESIYVLTVERVEQWASQFKCLSACSRNLSVCFKAQVNISKFLTNILLNLS